MYLVCTGNVLDAFVAGPGTALRVTVNTASLQMERERDCEEMATSVPYEDASALLGACTRGDAGSVEQLLDAHADPNVAVDGLSSALHLACSSGHEHIVAMLLTAGARTDVRDASSRTSRQCAEKAGHGTCVAVIDTHQRLQDNHLLRELKDAHDVSLHKLSEEASENAEALEALEAKYLAATNSSDAIEASLRAEVASLSAKLASATLPVDAEVGTADEAALWSSRPKVQNLRAQLAAETRARANLAEMLSERHRAYDTLAAKYKELRSIHRAQVDANTTLAAELERMRADAESTDKLLLAEQSSAGSELTFARLECEELRNELAEVSATASAKISEQALQISSLEEELSALKRLRSINVSKQTTRPSTRVRSPGGRGSPTVFSSEMTSLLQTRFDYQWSSAGSNSVVQSLAARHSPQRQEAHLPARSPPREDAAKTTLGQKGGRQHGSSPPSFRRSVDMQMREQRTVLHTAGRFTDSSHARMLSPNVGAGVPR